jgi:hypothetical protein
MILRKTKILSVLLSLIINFPTFADTKSKVTEILFYSKNHPKKSVLLSDLKELRSQGFVHPDKVIDPEQKTRLYGGADVTNLIKSQFKNLKDEEIVTIISSDTYVVSLPYSEIKKSLPMIGLQTDGKPSDWKKGSPGLMFPPDERKLDTQTDPSWWGWWTSAIVAGDPFIKLQWNDTPVDVSKCTQKYTRILPYPRGRRVFKSWKDKKVTLDYCKLSEVLPKSFDPKTKIAFVENLIGKKTMLDMDNDKLFLLHKVNGEAIPATMGGPYQVCKNLDAPECLYFVSAISSVQEKK